MTTNLNDLSPTRNRLRQTRDRTNPTLLHATAVDPLIPIPADSRENQITSLERWHRTWLLPVSKILMWVTVRFMLGIKKFIPGSVGSEKALNRLGPWFMQRYIAPETLAYILRHFTIETNLINFVARNSGATDVAEVTLKPTEAAHLGDDDGQNAVVKHDVNIFNLIIDLGESIDADVTTAKPLADLDFSMLEIPEYDTKPEQKRRLNLDIQTSLNLIILTLAVFMDRTTAERAANSLQFDESLLAAIANLTGDPVFRTWTPIKFPTWWGLTADTGRDLHWHMIVNEYAHTRLLDLAAQQQT